LKSVRVAKEADERLKDLRVCVVEALSLRVLDSPEGLAEELSAAAARRRDRDIPDDAREAMRAALRRGGYKPSGRGKPSSEYLCRAAREGNVPSINNLVDCNNALSLEAGLPSSILDAQAFGEEALIRICAEGDRYVFNAAGQEMDLSGLACVCAGSSGKPLGNAVKDSMAGKIGESCGKALGFIYAPASLPECELRAWGERLAELLRTYGGEGATASVIAIL
jgi:DNA/RNA-binding domain of Phe-tRNA-synthetase-like protein